MNPQVPVTSRILSLYDPVVLGSCYSSIMSLLGFCRLQVCMYIPIYMGVRIHFLHYPFITTFRTADTLSTTIYSVHMYIHSMVSNWSNLIFPSILIISQSLYVLILERASIEYHWDWFWSFTLILGAHLSSPYFNPSTEPLKWQTSPLQRVKRES